MTFCTTAFRALAQTRRNSLGLPDLPIVLLPHPMMTRGPEEVDRIAEQVLPEVLRHLTGIGTEG